MNERQDSFNPFDPVALSKVSNMAIRARLVVEGALSGIHKGSCRGSSIEFLDHKEYSPGDEMRQIDWRLFARSDRYYIKQFENETNLRSCILLDASGSMGYKSNGISKLEYAATLAASLAYMFIRQSDAVGLLTFSDKIMDYLPPRAEPSHLYRIIDLLKGLSGRGKTNIAGVLASFLEKVRKKGAMIIISDFFDDVQGIVKPLRQYRSKKNDVILFHILDPYELEFPFDGPVNLVSMEDDRGIMVDPVAIRRDYLSRINLFISELKEGCLANRIDYQLVNSATALDRALVSFLSLRKR